MAHILDLILCFLLAAKHYKYFCIMMILRCAIPLDHILRNTSLVKTCVYNTYCALLMMCVLCAFLCGRYIVLIYMIVILFIYTHLTSCIMLSIGVFYFLLGNLHPKYRSKLKSIQLVALCKNRYIKKYSLNAILTPIVSDLKKLVSAICNHM